MNPQNFPTPLSSDFYFPTCKKIYNKHEQQLDQKAASSIHDITCQTNFTSLYGTQLVTSVILNLKFMAQDTKLKKSKRLIDWLIDWLIGWFLGWCCCSG